MKKIEDIENMSLEELERIAGDETVKAPEHLRGKVMAAILAQAAEALTSETQAAEALAPETQATESLTAETPAAETAISEPKASETLPRRTLSFAGYRRPIALAAAAAAACLILFVTVPHQPKDTFDDPMLAYAELEKTLGRISSKLDKGMEIAAQAGPAIEKTTSIYNR